MKRSHPKDQGSSGKGRGSSGGSRQGRSGGRRDIQPYEGRSYGGGFGGVGGQLEGRGAAESRIILDSQYPDFFYDKPRFGGKFLCFHELLLVFFFK